MRKETTKETIKPSFNRNVITYLGFIVDQECRMTASFSLQNIRIIFVFNIAHENFLSFPSPSYWLWNWLSTTFILMKRRKFLSIVRAIPICFNFLVLPSNCKRGMKISKLLVIFLWRNVQVVGTGDSGENRRRVLPTETFSNYWWKPHMRIKNNKMIKMLSAHR